MVFVTVEKTTPVALLGSRGGQVSRIFLCYYWFESEEDNNGLKCGRAGVGVC